MGKIGSGMKPRSGKQKKAKEAVLEQKSPTAVGQETGENEAVLEQNPVSENGYTPEAEKVQILDPSVASPEEKKFDTLDGLEAAMNEPEKQKCCDKDDDVDGNCPDHSAPGVYRNVAAIEKDADRVLGIDMAIGPERTAVVFPSGAISIAELEDAMARHGNEHVKIMPNGNVTINNGLGTQPDGSLKLVVTVPEEYVVPVTDWAQEAGVPLDQWLSDRLYEYIVGYGNPAGKR